MHTDLRHELSGMIDAISADALPPDLYHRLFRRDQVTEVMYQRFLLSQYPPRPFQVHPVSMPAIPDLSTHKWLTEPDEEAFWTASAARASLNE
jgi:hypothetical protein